MRRWLLFCLLALILIAQGETPAQAQCESCAERAAQFWRAVDAEAARTSPALADYLARNEISRGRADSAVYFLTPDCGMHPAQLEETLDIAKGLNVRMTVFLMGVMIDKWPQESRGLMKRAVDEGHELALHSYSHRNFRNLTREQIYDEVARNWALIDWALGYHYPMRFIRMPYGARNAEILRMVGEMGLQSVFWDIDSLGWRDYATAPIVHNQVVSKMRPGAIVVLHCSAAMDRAALPLYVADLKQQGFQPALLSAHYPRPTAADLIGYPRPRATPTPTPAAQEAAETSAPAETPNEGKAERESLSERRLLRRFDLR